IITAHMLLLGGLYIWGSGAVMAMEFMAQPMEKIPHLNESPILPMRQLVTGQVVDNEGNPVPGATILVEGTTIGTATDIDGNFSLDVPNGAVLLVSFIGYKSLRIEVGNQSRLKLTLEEDASALDEVVVVGYGTVERREMTGSIASIGRQDI